jgi:hypothetical protein
MSAASSRRIRGTVEVDGRPAGVSRAIAVSGDLTAMVGSGVIGDGGGFEIEVPDAAERVVVMAGVTDPVVAVAHQAVDLGGSPASVALVVDTRRQPFHALSGEIEVPGLGPPFISLTVDPVHLEGVPAPLEPLFRRRDDRVVDASFMRLRLDEPRFELTLQQGTYRLDAGYVDRSRPNIVHPDFDNYVTRLTRIDGVETPAPERFGGIEVEVTRPVHLALVLAVLPDEELSPGDV